MPVPSYSTFTAGQTTQPDVNLTGPNGPNAQEITGSQAQQAGAAMQSAGDAASRIALSMQDQINQTRVNDATNQARIAAQDLTYNPQTGYKVLQGNDALQRPGGQPLADEYSDKLNSAMSNIAGGLGNDEQRRAFSQVSNALGAQFHGDVEAHAVQQFGIYHDSVNDATVALAANAATQNWDNPNAIFGSTDPTTQVHTPGAIDAIKAATYAKAQQHGLEGAHADMAILNATSAVHREVITAALDNNQPGYALSYMEAARKSGQMTGNDILALQGRVNQNTWLQLSAAAVGSAAADAARLMAPTQMDRFKQITMGTESGGKDTNPDGTPLTSSAGAMFGLQVMPATAANPGHGIAPATAQTAAEYNRVGTQLLAALVQKYGDPAEAWAAYNAGEGNVDKAIASATSAGEPGLWLQALGDYQSDANHAQTVAYVTKNMAAFNNPTATQAPRPTELDFINHALANLPPGAAPQLVQMTREHASQQFDVISKSLTEQGTNALGAVQQWLYSNQGSGATVADVPANLMAPLLQFAPGDAKNLEAFSKSLQRGDVVTNLGRYNAIVSNMDQYAKMSEPAWDMLQTELSPSTFMKLSSERQAYISSTVDDTSGGLDRVAINRSLNNTLASLQLQTTAKPNTADAAWLGATRLYVDQSIFQAQKSSGHKFTPDEIESHITNLFAKDVQFKNTIFGIPTGGTTSNNVMSLHLRNIPSADLDSLKSGYARAGVANPSDAQLLNAYRTLKIRGTFSAQPNTPLPTVAPPAADPLGPIIGFGADLLGPTFGMRVPAGNLNDDPMDPN